MSKGWGDELAILVATAWASLLRAPFACLPLTRQRAGEDLEPEERLDGEAAIGLVDKKLIAKLH